MKYDELPKLYEDENNVVYDVRNSEFSVFNKKSEGYVLDDGIVFGKDYPTGSFDYDTYQILNCIKNNTLSLNDVFEIYIPKTYEGENLLRKMILENNYIRPIIKESESDLKENLSKMNANELSDALKMYGIIASGKRKKLLKLALKNVKSTDFENAKYEITEKGLEFIDEFDWIGLYDFCLEKFEFDDFYKFYDENEFENTIELGLKYVIKHQIRANVFEDFEYLCDCMDATSMIHFYDKNKYNALVSEIKYFIEKINPIYDYKEYYKNNKLLKYENIESLKILPGQLDISDVWELFSEIWDERNIENEFISKKEAYEFAQKLFDKKNFDELCEEYIRTVIYK